MTSRQEAMEPFVRIRQRVEEILNGHGLSVVEMLFSVSDPVGVHIRTKIIDTGSDDGFDEVIASAQAAETERHAEEARRTLQEEMRHWLDE